MTCKPELIHTIKGFLDAEEGECLYRIAQRASLLGPCLEIGSYCGKSTVYIGTACQENRAVLFSIDHHRGSEEQQPGEEYFDPALFHYPSFQMDSFTSFRRTIGLANLEDTVVPIVAPSAVAARSWATPLGLVFIDGGHSYAAAFTDYNSWSNHIIPGGFLLIHDIFADPAAGGQAPFQVYQLALSSGLYKKLPMVKTLGVLRRLHCGESSS
ncbi:MAG: class I SAM-dependent methyltransferase [Thermodesulfobacteriota bacterium]